MLEKNRRILTIFIVLMLLGLGGFFVSKYIANKKNSAQMNQIKDTDQDTLADADEQTPVPQAIRATPDEITNEPRDTSALGGYNVLIADRGNNRLIEVTPDKKIIWEYDFHLPKRGLGADDAFFTDNGQTIIVNLEEYHIIELIDYQTKTVKWTYGTPNVPGHLPGFLNTPDDAYKLPNGDIIVADIKNCRIIEIAPDKQIVHQYGQTKVCDDKPGHLNKPNGDTPLPNGHILISNIVGKNLVEIDNQWQPVFSMPLPVNYPSDPQMTNAGNILISDYSKPGQIVEVSKAGNIVWQYAGDSPAKLNHPSLAIELPNGNILSNDDLNHRVIVIDKQTKLIVWQYGVTGKPGNNPGQLNIPDGVDIIKHSQPTSTDNASPLPITTIGSVTRHAGNFFNQTIRVEGYLLKKEKGYGIFSDERSGTIGSFDLPVTGAGVDSIGYNKKYLLEGRFVSGGLTSSNGNPNHLELTVAPKLIQ